MARNLIRSLVLVALLAAPLAAAAKGAPVSLQTKRQIAQHLNPKMWHAPQVGKLFDARSVRLLGSRPATPPGLTCVTVPKVKLTAANHKITPQLQYADTATVTTGRGPQGPVVSLGKIDFTLQPRSAPPR
jgi:hypothetical protein